MGRDEVSRDEVIVIGPPRSGKTTVARLVAAELALPLFSLDATIWSSFEREGYDRTRDRDLVAAGDLRALAAYRRPFEARAVASVLAEHRGVVFDLTATALVQEDPASFVVVREALRPFANVISLLPSNDPTRAVDILRARTTSRVGAFDAIGHAVRHPAYRELARVVLSTEDKSPRQTCQEILRAIAASPTILGEPDDDLDRTFIDQYIALQRARLRPVSDYPETLERSQAERLGELMRALEPKLDVPLPEASRAYVNGCFDEVQAATRPILAEARIPDEARTRADRIYAFRLGRGATLRDVLKVDPFDGLAPFLDSAVLEDLLLEPERVRPSVRVLQRAALHHRFLHRPQRTAYLFFHEAVVGFLLNVFENGGAVHARRSLTVSSPTYSEVPAYFIDALAKWLGRSIPEVVGLHVVDRETIDAKLPEVIRDLFLVADYLYTFMELKMLYIQRSVGRRINANLHLFFTIRSLERLAADPTLRLVRDAGKIVDDAFCQQIYGYEGMEARGSNEADIVSILCGFVESLWQPTGKATAAR